ncbi:inositol monophosphatase family protein [Chromohalobacter beijerinckii]|uniref:Inositol monophosphatase family protein n=1 Tax=Chromohalobacter beijerinckii TaxID=86179 RepID=A0ABV8XBM7_9GAMM|nr:MULTISPECIES: inositol monophosphatase [Chromohalobacter]MCK0765799.1 inositol monophosphatase [Chromohalobacter beijerinckii]MCT8469158.1 inositol monophosphatase [Chromohalobacter canadensis]MCT8472652.1 inositol monophosphatase [Chromohalobacter canadensis]MCT8500105.1 inositol monophosphatase [Chromohalobacter canadensis]
MPASAISLTQQQRLIEIVRDAAKTEILPRFRNLSEGAIRSKSAPDDLVTDADQGAERMMTAAIRELLPEATVIGEEAVAEGSASLDDIADAELALIIDPVDGTWNFARGLNQFGVILAATSFGETIFGLLYDPMADDWIVARHGEGAWFGRPDGTQRQLQVSDTDKFDEMVGSTSIRLFAKPQQYQLAATFPDFQRMMAFGCACHEYRTMAFGFVDFMLTGKLMPWDHAAGLMIHAEAGGYSALLDGTPYQPTIHQGKVLAASSHAHWEQLREKFSFLV